MSETLIKVDGASKKFCRNLKKSLWYGLQDLGREVTARRHGGNGQLRPDEFWALRDVGFELKRGECLGLLGRNGAGKTTLLRMLNGLIKPDAGRIEVRGRVGALIALGAGFNPILTGRENIYVNGAVLGLSRREIDAKVDEIVDFAELAEFIDMPVQSYSSGMAVRLGFSIATSVQPDVLLLDEVLAVGDAGFRQKCYMRLSELMSRAAVIFVTHSMDYVGQICTNVLHLQGGHAKRYHDVMEGVNAYLGDSQLDKGAETEGHLSKSVYPPIAGIEVRQSSKHYGYGDKVRMTFAINCEEALRDVDFNLVAFNRLDQPVMCWNSSVEGWTFDLQPGTQTLTLEIEPLLLHSGHYYWHFAATPRGTVNHCVWLRRFEQFNVVGAHRNFGDIPYLPRASLCILEMESTSVVKR